METAEEQLRTAYEWWHYQISNAENERLFKKYYPNEPCGYPRFFMDTDKLRIYCLENGIEQAASQPTEGVAFYCRNGHEAPGEGGCYIQCGECAKHESTISQQPTEGVEAMAEKILLKHYGRPNQPFSEVEIKRNKVYLKAMVEMYQAGQQAASPVQQEWVSVEDRLPESDVPVFCCLGNHYNVGFTFGVNKKWRIIFITDDEQGHYASKEVTHWMPLPAPPVNNDKK